MSLNQGPRRGSEKRRAPEAGPRADEPELPTGKAFVLQLSRDTGPTLEPFIGRVEHLDTGRRLRFETFAAFRAAVSRLLAGAQSTRDDGASGQ